MFLIIYINKLKIVAVDMALRKSTMSQHLPLDKMLNLNNYRNCHCHKRFTKWCHSNWVFIITCPRKFS